MNSANKHLKEDSGIGSIVNKTRKGSGYNYTVKYTIIGTSGAGKTTLACNLAIFDIKNYNCVVYINDHFDDNTMTYFRECCNKADIKYYQVMIEEDGSLNVPKVKHALFIIDDTYTARNRNKNVEKLVAQLIIKGRHPEWSSHVIYIVHLNKYSHMEAINMSTAIFLEAPDDHYPITNEIKPPYNKWYKLTNYLDPNETVMEEVNFKKLKQKSEIVQRLKVKKVKEKKKESESEKSASEEEYEGVAGAGNEAAEDTLEKNIKKRLNFIDGPILNEGGKKPGDDDILIKGKHF